MSCISNNWWIKRDFGWMCTSPMEVGHTTCVIFRPTKLRMNDVKYKDAPHLKKKIFYLLSVFWRLILIAIKPGESYKTSVTEGQRSVIEMLCIRIILQINSWHSGLELHVVAHTRVVQIGWGKQNLQEKKTFFLIRKNISYHIKDEDNDRALILGYLVW